MRKGTNWASRPIVGHALRVGFKWLFPRRIDKLHRQNVGFSELPDYQELWQQLIRAFLTTESTYVPKKLGSSRRTRRNLECLETMNHKAVSHKHIPLT